MALPEWATTEQQAFLLRVTNQMLEPHGWSVYAAAPLLERGKPEWKLMMDNDEGQCRIHYVVHGLVQEAEKHQHDGLLKKWIEQTILPALEGPKGDAAD